MWAGGHYSLLKEMFQTTGTVSASCDTLMLDPHVSWYLYVKCYNVTISHTANQRLFYQETSSSGSPFQRAPGAEFRSQSLEDQDGQVRGGAGLHMVIM